MWWGDDTRSRLRERERQDHLTLCVSPSHVETAASSVVCGARRARRDARSTEELGLLACERPDRQSGRWCVEASGGGKHFGQWQVVIDVASWSAATHRLYRWYCNGRNDFLQNLATLDGRTHAPPETKPALSNLPEPRRSKRPWPCFRAICGRGACPALKMNGH